jgi:hypothetical protein
MIKTSPFSLTELRKKGAIIFPYKMSNKYLFTVLGKEELIAEIEALIVKNGYELISRHVIYKDPNYIGSDCVDFKFKVAA